MPYHVGPRRSGAARYATAVALLVAQGCRSDDASVLVIVTHDSGRAVIAAPVDPRTARVSPSRRGGTDALTKSIARYYAVTDSADSLDAAFRRARDSLNHDARALAGADRRAVVYSRRFDEYMARVAVATRTREARDRARRRAASLRAQLGANAPDLAERRTTSVVRMRAALDSAVRASGRNILRASLRDGRAAIQLQPGVWWLAVEDDHGRLGGVRRHQARAGARDTVRIGG